MIRKLRQLDFLIQRIVRQESNQGQSGKRLFAMVGWQLYRRICRRPITVTLFNGLLMKAYGDCHMSANVIYFHIPAYREIRFLRPLINGGELIDIGANVGLFTLMIADKVHHAILFEPTGLAARRAAENLALNRLNFEVQALALSDKRGEVYFQERGEVDTQNMVVTGPGRSPFPIRQVPCDTLDHFLEGRRISPFNIALIKIDVEGHENSVLRGMQQTLIQRKPKVVMFEYLSGLDFQETQALLDRTGYKIFSLSEQGHLVPVCSPPELDQNLFALPERNSFEH
jgi:FkbM family methyltransferase